MPETNHLVMNDKDVIEIIVEPCGMPVSYKGVYYYRSGATKQELRGVALHQFLLKKMGLNWEDIQCADITLDEIDDEAVAYFLRKAIISGRMNPEVINSTKEEVLSNLGLLVGGVLTNAAVLLFGKFPQRKFVTSGFKIGRFGMNDADLLSHDLIEGNLIQMTDKIMQVLSDKYLIRPIRYEGLERHEPFEIPESALREMIFNSIVHKVQSGTWNQMSIYDSHIRLWNEGELPENYTVETLLGKHTSKPRNPKIANVFFKAGFIESWGRGYEKIMTAFDAENLVRPTFVLEQGGITANIPRERFMAIRGGNAVNVNETDTKPIRNRLIAEQKSRILELLGKNPDMSMDALGRILAISKSSVQRRIDSLAHEGRLQRVGRYWNVSE
ncbi:winged helix-turn-helix transcriptional regulator [Palleniella muris]|uniref:Winged helix-turn-helix transcriptional regulator n=1 Tax=Palleniella muris TaxID=3038145 RepID=A0AC61QM95_9BACT|nr:winged helix-turn-helix transcriptional regulator [Palleniella muris]